MYAGQYTHDVYKQISIQQTNQRPHVYRYCTLYEYFIVLSILTVDDTFYSTTLYVPASFLSFSEPDSKPPAESLRRLALD